MENLKKKKQEWFFKFRKKPNPIAKDLRTSPQYKQKIVKDKTKYDRKAGNQALEKFKEMFEKW